MPEEGRSGIETHLTIPLGIPINSETGLLIFPYLRWGKVSAALTNGQFCELFH